MRRWGLGALYGLALLLASLALFVPGRAQLPPIDRDESRYMEATAQMLEKGDYVDVRFQDKPRYLQPAGIYWLEAAAVAAFGAPGTREPWAYRLPSLAGAVVAVLLTGWIGGTLFGANAGLLAGLLLGASVLLSVESRMATIDATLLAVVLTAQAVLLRVYLRRDGPEPTGRPVAALYWAALGVGLMLKGPVILLVSWGTILALLVSERRGGWLRRLHPAWGVPLMLAILLPWLIAAWWSKGSRRQRRIAAVTVAVALIPIVYSLNRGLWLALGVTVLYLALRQAIRGRFAFLAGIGAALALSAVIITVSPLQQVISLRMAHGKSNSLRSSLSTLAVRDGLASPVIGYGNTRREIGSPNSIAVGPSAKCGNCGQASVGSNGQLWLLLICDGVTGAALYLGFFVWIGWRYRRDQTPYGWAGTLVVLLSFVFMISYDAVGAPLAITMLSVALLWRNERDQRGGAPPLPAGRGAAWAGRRSPPWLRRVSP
jgi:4-amino-4-deoxy-L-arabinose transferase-like glycosyltransferase